MLTVSPSPNRSAGGAAPRTPRDIFSNKKVGGGL